MDGHPRSQSKETCTEESAQPELQNNIRGPITVAKGISSLRPSSCRAGIQSTSPMEEDMCSRGESSSDYRAPASGMLHVYATPISLSRFEQRSSATPVPIDCS